MENQAFEDYDDDNQCNLHHQSIGYIFQPDGTLLIQDFSTVPQLEIPTGYSIGKIILDWCTLKGNWVAAQVEKLFSLPTLACVEINALQAENENLTVLAETLAGNSQIIALHLRFYSKQIAEVILSAFAERPPRLEVLELAGWQNYDEDCGVSLEGKENVLLKLKEFHYTEQEQSPFVGLAENFTGQMSELKRLKITLFCEEEFPIDGRMQAIYASSLDIESLEIVVLDSLPRQGNEIVQAISQLHSLKELNLTCNEDQISFQELMEALRDKQLESLEFGRSSSAFKNAIEAISLNLSNLKRLKIPQVPLHQELLDFHHSNSTIEHFEYEDSSDANNISIMRSLLEKFQALKYFSVAYLGKDAESFILNFPKDKSPLKLSICTEIESSNFFPIFNQQVKNGNLSQVQELSLWIPNVLGNADYLADALALMTELKVLDIELFFDQEAPSDELVDLIDAIPESIEVIHLNGVFDWRVAKAIDNNFSRWPLLKRITTCEMEMLNEIPFEQRRALRLFYKVG